jgi:hypothetical protein
MFQTRFLGALEVQIIFFVQRFCLWCTNTMLERTWRVVNLRDAPISHFYISVVSSYFFLCCEFSHCQDDNQKSWKEIGIESWYSHDYPMNIQLKLKRQILPGGLAIRLVSFHRWRMLRCNHHSITSSIGNTWENPRKIWFIIYTDYTC